LTHGNETDSNDLYDFTHDAGFKDVVMDYPHETVDWLVPEAIETFGVVEDVAFIREEMKKQWLSDPGRELDIPMKFRFEKGPVILILIEHKSDKESFTIEKLAHYTLDLIEMYPGMPIIPIAVFADPAHWRKDVVRVLDHRVMGQTYLYFTFKKVKLKNMDAAEIRESDNPVLHLLSPLMDYPEEDRCRVAADAYINLRRSTDTKRFMKYVDYIDRYAKITKEEKNSLMALLTTRKEGIMLREALMEEGLEKGREEGLEKGGILGKIQMLEDMWAEDLVSREKYEEKRAILQHQLALFEAKNQKNP
jgi:hypothetical protein